MNQAAAIHAEMHERLGEAQYKLDVRRVDKFVRSGSGRTCKCCELSDEDRHELNMQVLKRIPFRTIAQQFNVHHVSVMRHTHNHLIPEILRLIEEDDALMDNSMMSAERLITDLGAARTRALEISRDAPEVRDQLGGLKVMHAISRTGFELNGQLRGAQTNVQIVNTTAVEGQVAPVLDRVMDALADFPEAAMAVAESLGRAQDAVMIEATAIEEG